MERQKCYICGEFLLNKRPQTKTCSMVCRVKLHRKGEKVLQKSEKVLQKSEEVLQKVPESVTKEVKSVTEIKESVTKEAESVTKHNPFDICNKHKGFFASCNCSG